jgi:ketosteroid isomerase-like protein
MSENLELVHAILADWERGNFRSVDWADAHIEYAIADDPGAKIGRGIPAMTRTWREFLSAWEDYRVEAREFRELDDERVLVALTARGRGKTSGLDLGETRGGWHSANVFQMRGGKVTRLLSYFDRDRALVDVGLATAPRRARAHPLSK